MSGFVEARNTQKSNREKNRLVEYPGRSNYYRLDTMSRPIETRERRRSFLDIGGPNSLNNFATSYARTQSSFARALGGEDELSPLSSPTQRNDISEYGYDDEESTVEYSPQHGDRSIHDFLFAAAPSSRKTSSVDESSLLLAPATTSSSVLQGHGKIDGSTGPQTIFNSINTMMGIGMLSLPFGFRLSGWVMGSLILGVSALSTNYTAKLLGRILNLHPQLRSYSDISHFCFGKHVNVIVLSIFMADLILATSSLVLLFGDSLSILLPHVDINVFKTMVVVLTFFSSFLPLSVLSMTSFLGILSTTGIVVVIIICGLTASPTDDAISGSLLHPAVTYMWPENWFNLLLALGIFMAPWGGHVVFPELYRDMRHPAKYDHCTNVTFNFTFSADYIIAAVGYLMFGDACEDSFSKNLMLQANFPKWVKPLICFLMSVLALVKAPLMVRPVFLILEKTLSIETLHVSAETGMKYEVYGFKRIFLRFMYCLLILFISMTFVSFGGVIAFLGSAVCFSICLVLPLAFYMNVFKNELSKLETTLLSIALVLGVIFAVIGTYGAIAIDV